MIVNLFEHRNERVRVAPMRWRVRHFLELRQRAFRRYLLGLPVHNELLQYRSAISAARQMSMSPLFSRPRRSLSSSLSLRPAHGVRRIGVSGDVFHASSMEHQILAASMFFFSSNCSRKRNMSLSSFFFFAHVPDDRLTLRFKERKNLRSHQKLATSSILSCA